MKMIWRWPYNDYDVGFWGKPTVTINFCEEDYAVTYYCAEICNTLTNAMFVWLGLRGVRSCVRYKHPTIFLVAYLGYLVVGMGSISFHASLKYPMQLVDELSMIYTTCLMMFATFSYNRSKMFSFLMGIGLLGLAGFITVYYHFTKNPVFHETCYAILTATVVFRGMWVMEAQLRPAMKMRKSTKDVQEKLRTMWLLVGLGLSVFLGGFFIWNLDNVFCSTIRQWRRSLGLPVAFLLEGHGWWHLMTGLAYYYIVWGTWLRHCLAGNDDRYDLRWSRNIASIPEVVLIEDPHKEKKRN